MKLLTPKRPALKNATQKAKNITKTSLERGNCFRKNVTATSTVSKTVTALIIKTSSLKRETILLER